MSARDHRRLKALAFAGLVAFLVLFLRLVQIQVVQHPRFERAAKQQQTRRVILEPPRGRIYDRHLRPLADNVSVSRLSVRPRDVKNARAMQAFLAKAAGPDAVSRFRAGRSRRAAYVRLARELTPEQELRLRTMQLPKGVQVEAVPSRVYPLESAARPVVGFVGAEGGGLEGLEKVFDRELLGSGGWATLFCDARGLAYELPRSMVKVPEPGHSIVTTIDLDAQTIVMRELSQAVDRTGSKGGTAVFVDPRTGDVLAMATVDAPGRTGSSGHRNRVVADQYEPGSTFKLLAGCAALEERLAQPTDSFWVEEGEADLGGFVIHDSHPETRWFTVRSGTAHSSNVVYATLGTQVGASKLYGYARLFGFGQPTRIALPGEAPGQIRHPDRWSHRSLATISIGQEVLVTPLQMVMAYAAVANGGTLLRPRIVSAVMNEDGEPVRELPVEKVRRVISSETARTFRSFLREAVLEGTGTEAGLPWCEVAGKTGTAQKTGEGRGYEAGRYMSSFVGMAPYDDPRVVGLIVLDEPRGAYYGGSVAAPVFRDILAAWALQGRGPIALPPSSVVRSEEEEPTLEAVPDVRLLDVERAREVLARSGYGMKVEGGRTLGGRIAGQAPEPGVPARRGSVVTLRLAAAAPGEEVTVPDLRGLALREALARLSGSAIEVARVQGNGMVVRQSPDPGTTVRKGTKCSLVLSPRGV